MERLKTKNLLLMAVNELFANKKTLLLFTSIIALVFSIALSLLSVAFSINTNYNKDIDIKYPNGIVVQTDASIEEINMLIPYSDIIYLVDSKLTNNCYFKSDYCAEFIGTHSEEIIDGATYYNYYSGEAHLFMERLPNKYLKAIAVEGFIVDGNLWENSSSNNDIFISKYYANKLKVGAGDTIEYFWDKKAESQMYVVKGVYDPSVLSPNFDYIPNFVIPLNSLVNIIENNVGIITPTIYCGVDTASEIINGYLYADNANISFITLNNFFDVIKEIRLIEYTFLSLSIIVILVALFIFQNLVTMFLGERTKFIGIIKSVGMRQKDISNLYIIVCFILECIALFFGTLLSLLINLYIEQSLTGLFAFPFEVYFRWYVPLLAFAMILALSILVVLAINKRLKTMQVSDIIRYED